MKSSSLRLKLLSKRALLTAVGYKPDNFTSIERLEKPSRVSCELVCHYSDDQLLEVFDPRNQRSRKHYFESRSLQLLENVVLEPKQGLIFNSFGELIVESTPWSPLHVYNSFPWNGTRNISKLDVKNAIYLSSNSFYHWLIEDLPSTIFCMQKFPDSPIVVHRSAPSYVKDFLNLIDNQVVYVEGPISVKSLLCVTKGSDSGWPHPSDLKVLEAYEPFSNAQKSAASMKKVYVSRVNSRRSPSNESAIIKVFSEKGYESVELETLNLVEQIGLLSNATALAGIHGAGLANMIWMKMDSSIVDIANSGYWTECFHRLAHLKKHNYRPILYNGSFKSQVDLSGLRTI
jgi:hypothetical protein